MGSASERMIEMMEQQRDAAIAEHLGLTYDEYVDSGAELEDDAGNDEMVYGTYVVFPSDTDPDILEKVKDLDGDRVILPPGFLTREEPEPEED